MKKTRLLFALLVMLVAASGYAQDTYREAVKQYLNVDEKFERSKANSSETEELTLQYFIGFMVVDKNGEKKGVITDVDDQTENWLFELESPDGVLHYIPAHEEFIVSMDHECKKMVMDLPDGIWDL